MSQKHIITMVVIAVVSGGAGFFGGLQYGKAKAPKTAGAANFQNMTAQQRQQLFQNGGAGGLRAGRGANGGGLVAGQILKSDPTSLTIQMQDGSTKIVLYSASTTITKTASGTPTDLANGEQVGVVGTSNSDGSVTAQTIQIRPNTTRPPQTNNQ